MAAPTIQITIQFEEQLFEVSISPKATILELKEAIKKIKGIPEKQQMIIQGGIK